MYWYVFILRVSAFPCSHERLRFSASKRKRISAQARRGTLECQKINEITKLTQQAGKDALLSLSEIMLNDSQVTACVRVCHQ